MTANPVLLIRQLSNRLEDASSKERIEALSELLSLARTHSQLVGAEALERILQLLRENGSIEEYQEALDVIHRLVRKTAQSASAAIDNSNIILSDTRNVDLLLDLLEHTDLTIAVMTSQILTEIHLINGASLEAKIQLCPDGNNSLIQKCI